MLYIAIYITCAKVMAKWTFIEVDKYQRVVICYVTIIKEYFYIWFQIFQECKIHEFDLKDEKLILNNRYLNLEELVENSPHIDELTNVLNSIAHPEGVTKYIEQDLKLTIKPLFSDTKNNTLLTFN